VLGQTSRIPSLNGTPVTPFLAVLWPDLTVPVTAAAAAAAAAASDKDDDATSTTTRKKFALRVQGLLIESSMLHSIDTTPDPRWPVNITS
jgi:uncharacterized protein (DUF1684 family)